MFVVAATAGAPAAEQSPDDASRAAADCKSFADVKFNNLNVQEVISTCLSAVRTEPDDYQLHGHLGRGYLKAGQNEKALQHIRLSADKGFVRAMTLLGYMYKVGRGVSRDDDEAARLFRKAADKGHAAAMAYLGGMYLQGHGVPRDDAEAVRWARKAEAEGDTVGMGLLGILYMRGRGVPLNYGEAVRLFRKAADNGDSRAFYLLGGMYEAGSGVGQDSKIAASHVFRSLKKGNKYAARQLAAKPDGWSTVFYLELQRLLKEEGVYSGPLDGRFGPAVQSGVDVLLRE